MAVVTVGGLGFVVVRFAGGGGGGGANKIDLTYILPDTNIIMRLNANQLLTSPLLSSVITQLEAGAPSPIPGIGVRDMESFTIGAYDDKKSAAMPMGGGMGMSGMDSTTRAMVVVRTKVAMKPEELGIQVLKGVATTHNGKTYYKKADGVVGSLAGQGNSVYFPEPTVAVIANEADMKLIIDQGSKQPRRKDLDFINPDMTLIVAVVHKGTFNPSAPLTSPANLPNLQALERAVNKSMTSMAVGIKLSDKIDIEVLAGCANSAGAGELKTAVEQNFAELKSQYEKSKNLLTLMDLGDVMGLADKALASLKVTQTGTQVVAVGTITSDLKAVIEKRSSMLGGMGGGMGTPPPAGLNSSAGTSGVTTPDLSQLPPGTLPPGSLEPGAIPPGTLQPGTTPMPTLQPGTTPPTTLQPGTTPMPTLQPGTTPPTTLQPGTTPMPTLQPGATPPTTLQPGNTQPGALATPTVQPGAAPKK